jgi:hypothetical protein
LIALLLPLPLMGCSGTSVAQNIVNWTPALQSAVATVDSTATLLDRPTRLSSQPPQLALTLPVTCSSRRRRHISPIRRPQSFRSCKRPS